MSHDFDEILDILFTDDNLQDFGTITIEEWGYIEKIANNKEEKSYDLSGNYVVLYFSEEDRPSGQKFKTEDEYEHHSELKVAKIDEKTVKLKITVKNYGSYYHEKQKTEKDGDVLFPEITISQLKKALNGTEEDWSWARKKFQELLARAKRQLKEDQEKTSGKSDSLLW